MKVDHLESTIICSFQCTAHSLSCGLSASQNELYPVSGSVSCPELTSTARCAFAFLNWLSRRCQNPVQNVCVSDLMLFSSLFFICCWQSSYKKLKVAVWWQHNLMYSVNFLELKTSFSVQKKKREWILNFVRQMNPMSQRTYCTHLYISDVCSVVKNLAGPVMIS